MYPFFILSPPRVLTAIDIIVIPLRFATLVVLVAVALMPIAVFRVPHLDPAAVEENPDPDDHNEKHNDGGRCSTDERRE